MRISYCGEGASSYPLKSNIEAKIKYSHIAHYIKEIKNNNKKKPVSIETYNPV